MIRRYETLTGRQFDLMQLTSAQRQALRRLMQYFESGVEWGRFSVLWQKELADAMLSPSPKERMRHPLYRIAQDLEMRLGISQGLVAPPDYRDYIVDRIEEKFGSRCNFCKTTGIREAFLSQVLAGKKDFSVAKLREVAEALGLRLALVPVSIPA
ncbi:MAG: hypothetical protein AB1714_11115 [Acidobacteriota bacterium]